MKRTFNHLVRSFVILLLLLEINSLQNYAIAEGNGEQKIPDTDIIAFNNLFMNMGVQDDGKIDNVVQMSLSIKLSNIEDFQDVDSKQDEIKDAIKEYFKHAKDTDISGADGFYKLKQDLKQKINAVIDPKEILEVYISDITVQ
jgi:flagellar basal body-associated protein FliL